MSVSSIEQMQHNVLPVVRQSAFFKAPVVSGLERKNICDYNSEEQLLSPWNSKR